MQIWSSFERIFERVTVVNFDTIGIIAIKQLLPSWKLYSVRDDVATYRNSLLNGKHVKSSVKAHVEFNAA